VLAPPGLASKASRWSNYKPKDILIGFNEKDSHPPTPVSSVSGLMLSFLDQRQPKIVYVLFGVDNFDHSAVNNLIEPFLWRSRSKCA
jgi:hypothetical protein